MDNAKNERLRQLDELGKSTTRLMVETSILLDQRRWYPWLIFGSVGLGVALATLGILKVIGG